jgi:hypothetical protein
VNDERHARVSIAAAATDLLVKAVDTLRYTRVNHRSNVRLIHPKSERGRCNNDIRLLFPPAADHALTFS